MGYGGNDIKGKNDMFRIVNFFNKTQENNQNLERNALGRFLHRLKFCGSISTILLLCRYGACSKHDSPFYFLNGFNALHTLQNMGFSLFGMASFGFQKKKSKTPILSSTEIVWLSMGHMMLAFVVTTLYVFN
ncbi:hypothetical protein ACJX0J_022159, partial [Zea mays]